MKSWAISDSFWAKVEPLIPVVSRAEGRQYLRKPGGGRKPMPPRQIFSAIVYVLRTGCQWKALPREYGSASAVHLHFQKWQEAGFFLRLWRAGLAEYDEMYKAPLAPNALGPTQRIGGKNGRKRSLLVDGIGGPLSLVVSGANTHDVKLLEATLDQVVMEMPGRAGQYNLCADAGYKGAHALNAVVQRDYRPHIKQRREEAHDKITIPGFKARRWVVERTHSWINRFRKLLVSFEKTEASYVALLSLACAMICWRQTVVICG
jgi:putative transposase